MAQQRHIAFAIGLAGALGWAATPALAQTRSPLPPETPSHQSVPEAQGSGSSNEPLSEQLNRSGGVIKPPAGIDSGLAKSPPSAGAGSTPIIPPPGTPGSNSNANPK